MIKTIIICFCLIGFVLLMFYLGVLFYKMAKVYLTTRQSLYLSLSTFFIVIGAGVAYDLIISFIQGLLN